MKSLLVIFVLFASLSMTARSEMNDFSIGASANYYLDTLGIGLHTGVGFSVNPKMKIGVETGIHRFAKKRFKSAYNAEAATTNLLIPALLYARYYIQNTESKKLYLGGSVGAVYLTDSSTLTLSGATDFTDQSSAVLFAFFAKAGVENMLSPGSSTYWYVEPNVGFVRDTLTILVTGGLRFPF